MTKKATITKEIIVNAAFEIARTEGEECVNARSIAKKIGCTTQPVLYHFSSVMEIKKEVLKKADLMHTEYIMDICGKYDNPMLAIGMQYIRFALEEKHLFRLLFQSNKFASKGFSDLMSGEEISSLITIMSSVSGISEKAMRKIFACIFLPVHGFASLIANNAMIYDEEYIVGILSEIYRSVISNLKENDNND